MVLCIYKVEGTRTNEAKAYQERDVRAGTDKKMLAKPSEINLTPPAPNHKISKGAIEMLEAKIKEYREMKRLAEEAQAAADSLADEIKAAMNEAGESKMVVGEYMLSYTDAKRETLDKKRLQEDLGDLSEYTKTTHYKVFKVA